MTRTAMIVVPPARFTSATGASVDNSSTFGISEIELRVDGVYCARELVLADNYGDSYVRTEDHADIYIVSCEYCGLAAEPRRTW